MDVKIITFGYLHGAAPEAELVLDLRRHFRDPHVNPELRYKTARDQEVRDAVAATPGVLQVVAAAITMTQSYAMGPVAATAPFRVAFGCAGGRHRAATAGEMLQQALTAAQFTVTLTHRDLDKDVVETGRESDRTQVYADVIEQALDSLWQELDEDDEFDTTVAAENAAGALVNAGY
ncbi:ATPase [Kitasatospora sp. NPDC101801]|uniref:RapZ C-terminal domain-containing protein n=1 Tax=Kitasatospora sp. NPDC101801 TaxID=3364103 RepID=UPI00380BAA8F